MCFLNQYAIRPEVRSTHLTIDTPWQRGGGGQMTSDLLLSINILPLHVVFLGMASGVGDVMENTESVQISVGTASPSFLKKSSFLFQRRQEKLGLCCELAMRKSHCSPFHQKMQAFWINKCFEITSSMLSFLNSKL